MRADKRHGRFSVGLIIALLAGIVPLGWAGFGRVIAGVDTPPVVDYDLLVKTTLHTWDPVPDGGISNYVGYGMYWPLLVGGAFLQRSAHVPAWVIGAALLALSWALAALGAYRLAAELGARTPLRAVAALAYTLNFAHTLLAPGLHGMIAYAAPPWLAVALLTGLRSTGPRRVALAALSALATTLLIYIKINPPTYITMWIGAVLIAAICAVAVRARPRPLLEWVVPFTLLTIAFNSWWIYDFWVSMKLDAASMTAQLDTQWVSKSSTIGQVLLLGGSWALDGAVDPGSPFSYAPWYRLPLVQSLLALFPAGVLLATVPVMGSRAVRLALAAILLVIFIDAGYHEPFGGLFTWCFEHIPGFWLFREPLTKFDGLAALLYVVALIIAFRDAAPSSRRAVGSFVVVACIGAVIGGIPSIAGTVVRGDTDAAPGWRVVVPSYWTNLARNMNERGGGRLIVYPQAAFYQLRYSWGYDGTDINGMLFRHPFIDVTSSNGYTDSSMRPIELAWYDALNARDFDASSARLLTDQLAIGYLIDRGDTVGVDRPLGEAVFRSRLRALGFLYERSFGPIRLYQRRETTETREAGLEIGPYAISCGEADLLGLSRYVPSDRMTLRSPWSGCAGIHAALRPLPNATFALFGSVQGGISRIISGDPRVRIDPLSFPVGTGDALFLGDSQGELRQVVDRGYVGDVGPSTTKVEIVHAHLLREAESSYGGTQRRLPAAHHTRGMGLVEIQPLSADPLQIAVDVDPTTSGESGSHDTRDSDPFARSGSVFRVPLGRSYRISVHGATTDVPLRVREYVVLGDQSAPFRIAAFEGEIGTTSVSVPQQAAVRIPVHGPSLLRVTAELHDGEEIEFRSADAGDLGRVLAKVGPGTSEIRLGAMKATARVVAHTKAVKRVGRLTIEHTGLGPWAVHAYDGRVTQFTQGGASEVGSSGTYDATGFVAARLPEAYSNGWTLSVDGRQVSHRATIAVENAWLLPSGRHSYRLRFAPEEPAQMLRSIASALAIIVLLAAFGVLLLERRASPLDMPG